MNLKEKWQHDYRARRYMNHLSREELEERARDVFLNFICIDPQGRISVPSSVDESMFWMKLWGDICIEFQMRFGPFPAGFTNGFIKKTPIPDPRKPEAKAGARVAEAIVAKSLQAGHYLLKFGKKEHLDAVLNKGEIRVSPAAFYDDPSLRPALKDNELELSVQPVPGEFDFEDLKTKWPTNIVETDGRIVTLKADTNYYVYCLAAQISPRLFLDFSADACLLISDPKKFIDRMRQAISTKLQTWEYFAQPVIYTDPLNSRIFNVFICKHFRYSYQKEFRLYWLPSSPVDQLEHIHLEVGNLQNCCELFSLK